LLARSRLLDVTLIVVALLGPIFHLTGIVSQRLALLYSDYIRIGFTYGLLAFSAAAAAFYRIFTTQAPHAPDRRWYPADQPRLCRLRRKSVVGDVREAINNATMAPIEPGKVGIAVAPTDQGTAAIAEVRAIENAIRSTLAERP